MPVMQEHDVSAEPAIWRLCQVCSLLLRTPHLSFILPKAPCTFHCSQPSSYTSAHFDPQSWSPGSPSPCRLTVSIASFASAQRIEKYQTPSRMGIQQVYDLLSSYPNQQSCLHNLTFLYFLRLGTHCGSSLNTDPPRESSRSSNRQKSSNPL